MSRGVRPVSVVVAVLTVLVVGAQLSGGVKAPTTTTQISSYGVGMVTQTYVDNNRLTPAWGPNPARPYRTLVTTVLYPATVGSSTKPVPEAPADRSRAPYPLIVFAHGLGGTPQEYLRLLEHWAAAGYVVAAPLFPLSSGVTPGGPDAGDIVNQPGDMSFVIDSVLATSSGSSGPLAGLVDPREVGAAGHSNGAITTLGLIANTCCRDPMVKAAVVMAGTTEGFPGGTYNFTSSPPLLLVHGTADDIVPYRSAVLIFNKAHGPKGLLTIRGGGHDSAAALAPSSSAVVLRATTDFFNAYLKHDVGAVRRLAADGHSADTTLRFDEAEGGHLTLPVPPAPVVHLRASVSPATNLHDGQLVTVRWEGYTPGKVVNVLECSRFNIATASSAACDFSNAEILHPDPAGHGSLQLRVVTGKVGSGVCDESHQGCSIVVNNASSTVPDESRQLTIHFAS
jgi:dienelactone hydrolase